MAFTSRRKKVAEQARGDGTASLTPEQKADLQLKAAKQRLMQIQAKDRLIPFVKLMMPGAEDPDDVDQTEYKDAPHHRAIADALERLEQGDEFRHLILCVPPRHGKTELATKKFAAWVLGRHPKWKLAVASYSSDMAEDFGSSTRDTIQSPAFQKVFPDVELTRGGTAKDRIETTKGGMLVAVGRGGALTGRGANLAIVDDPFKDFEEARSQATRDIAWNWFTKVLMTRRMGKKLVLIIMTRWHEDDIVGRLTDETNPHYKPNVAKTFKIIKLPAIAGDDDPLGRAPGEALWPEEFDLEFLNMQQELDPSGFAAMYQQEPSVEDGDLFKREDIRYYDETAPPADLRIYAASDHAVSTKQKNDKTCMLIVGIDRFGRIYVLDCYWRKVKPDVAVEAMLDMADLRKPMVWWAGSDHITKSIGPFLHKRMQERNVFFPLREMTPIGDKVQGAQAIAARVAMGYVYFPRSAPWVEAAINQLLSFGPMSSKDDFVDALALIGRGLQFQINAAAPKDDSKGPKPGTFGWLKMVAKHQAREALRQSSGGY